MEDSLQKSDVFKGLSIEQYDEIVKSRFRKQLKPKSILFHQGDPVKKCYLVNLGPLKVTKLNEQGKKVIIRYISAGELTAAEADRYSEFQKN
ncbi:MAG: cyclic nucleotide-binding domain-containing protein [Deltaproteobacteria bacterium]|nr:cyclic nucleotide-binding domain-containing protein [Deltaproteobacteria bacterium]